VFVALNIPVTVLDDSDAEVIDAVSDALRIDPDHEVLEIVVTDVGGEPIRKEIPRDAIVQAFRPDGLGGD
jgi:hypothetical protein